MSYLVLVAAFPILLLHDRRLGFALITLAVILIYRARTRGAREIARRRVTDDTRSPRLKPWKDPWGTAGGR